MSVLSCQRKGCRSIMCDRYSYQHGYLCHDCFDELVDYIAANGGMATGELIQTFIRTPTSNNTIDRNKIWEQCSEIFPTEETRREWGL